MKKHLFTQEEINEIIYDYTVLKKGRKVIAKKFHIGDKTLLRVLKENNISVKTIQETNTSKYNINHNYFSNQGHNQAYIMGFLAADGNVSRVDNRIDLELFSQDHEILEKIRIELELEREVKIYTCSNGYEKHKLYFYSAQIKKDLEKYGIVPNKTYSKDFHFPYLLNNEYIIDYIRGMFDGDGSVKECNHTIGFQIDNANKEILSEIQHWFKKEHNIEVKIRETSKANIPLYRLYCYGENSRKIYNILYTPNSLFLQRKFDKWRELLK